jgi:hypothetical protein
MHVCVCACMRVCVCACVRVCVYACVRVYQGIETKALLIEKDSEVNIHSGFQHHNCAS